VSQWYRKVSDNLANLPACIDHYEDELEEARNELSMKGKTIEKHESELPGIMEYRFNQLQEIEAILEHLNLELRKLSTAKFKKFLEHYNRQLTSADAKKYAEGDPEVVDLQILINEFALVRNKFLGIMKGLDTKNWMLGHVTKLRVSGLDDAIIQ
jgi:predicted  nucleic acid-binding Zn-ribbon protein